MGRINWDNIIEEILIFIRNNATDPESRATNTTDEFDGDDNTKTFTLTQATVKNVKTVTVGGSAKSFGTDYTIDYENHQITFTSAPAAGTDNVDVNYDYGTTWAYLDYPRADLTQSSYPRISIDWVNVVTTPDGLGANGDFNDAMFAITIFGRNEDEVRTLVDEIRDDIAGSKKSFYYVSTNGNSYIQPAGISAMTTVSNREAQIIQCTLTFRIPFLHESNT